MTTRFRLVLSDIREHKFKGSFFNWLNPVCSCGFDIK